MEKNTRSSSGYSRLSLGAKPVHSPLQNDEDLNDIMNLRKESKIGRNIQTSTIAASNDRHMNSLWKRMSISMHQSSHLLADAPRELYINFFLKFCDSYGYFALSQILVIYLHQEFGASDLEAGAAYGLWGMSITLAGFATSCINDKLGIRNSLLLGFSFSTISNFILAITTSKTVFYLVLFLLLPLGNCMGIPMLTIGIKRYTKKINRGFAFGLFYAVMNVAALVSGPVVDLFNIWIQPRHKGLTGNRLVIISVTVVYIISWLVTFFWLREIKVKEDDEEIIDDANSIGDRETGTEMTYDSESCSTTNTIPITTRPNSISRDVSEESSGESTTLLTTLYSSKIACTEASYNPIQPLSDKEQTPSSLSTSEENNKHDSNLDDNLAVVSESVTTYEILTELAISRTFWRFVVFTLFLINLRSIFRHVDATLPTYLLRCFGPKYPKGIIYSINPFLIIFLTPVVAGLTSDFPHYDMIKYGSYVSAISPFFAAMDSSTWAVVLFMVVLSFGEAIWSPRLYDYTMSIAPEGKEASFSALASAPIFAAKVPVGLLSGYLVSTYLPASNTGDTKYDQTREESVCHRHGKTIWLIIGLLTLSSPLCITIFESCIREPVANKNTSEPRSGSTSLSPASVEMIQVESRHTPIQHFRIVDDDDEEEEDIGQQIDIEK